MKEWIRILWPLSGLFVFLGMKDYNLPFALSVLDLVPVKKPGAYGEAIEESAQLAEHAERLGYLRYWLAEHHNFEGIASSATSLLIGHIASRTSQIRVGSGGVMLPNHSSLIIAEQFGTLDALYPGRIDLGVGRAPGTDGLTAQALGRNASTINELFPRQILELQRYFSRENSSSSVRAIPGEGANVPIYILGSSTDSAYLAAELGLPYAFAGHFAPEMMERAFTIYHERFSASAGLEKPYTIACLNGIGAATKEEAEFLATTLYQTFLGLIRNARGLNPPPVENMDALWNPSEKAHLLNQLRYSFIGGPRELQEQMASFYRTFRPSEIMLTSSIHDQAARRDSYRILMEVASTLEL